ncbi:MAG: hypothetical protein ACE5OQ_01670 [Woeseia sp.]
MVVKLPRFAAAAGGVFLVSLGTLVYEIALTRVFSVIVTYHYVFLVVSGAMLGLSIGGVFDYLRYRRGTTGQREEFPLAFWAVFAALTMVGSIFLINLLGRIDGLLSLAAAAILPFFFTGVTLAAAFRRFAGQSGMLYAADLTGAGLGAIIAVVALNAFGGPNGILAAALIGAAGAAVLLSERPVSIGLVVLVLSVILLASGVFGAGLHRSVAGTVPIARDPDKDMFRLLSDPSTGGRVVESRWSAFGRTDLVEFDTDAGVMTLFIDGAAGTPMYQWDGDPGVSEGPVAKLMQHFPGSAPFLVLDDSQKDNALIIGPGGGRDVLINLFAGVREITAVEVNPEFVQIVADYSDYNGGIFTAFDNVSVVVEEGRSYLRRSSQRYDIIMLSLPITKSSRSYEGYALTENFLFTRESFHDYLNHLTDEGTLIVIGHSLLETMRLLMTSLAALREAGLTVAEAMERIYILGHPRMPVFAVRNVALTAQDADDLHAMLHVRGFDASSSYIPYVEQAVLDLGISEYIDSEWRMMNQNMIDLASGAIEPQQLVAAVPLDISPVTDDRPFFFLFEPRTPRVISGILWISVILLAGVIAVPAALRRTDAPLGTEEQAGAPKTVTMAFVAIGAGFMLLEVTLFQKLILYLGDPTFALALLLSSLLVGTSLGSLVSSIVRTHALVTALWISSFAIVVAVIAIVFVIDFLFRVSIYNASAMTAASAFVLVVLGFPLGFPFPICMRLLKQLGCDKDVPRMWAANGAASVFGSVLAIGIAINAGYATALVVGAATYIAVGIAMFAQRKKLTTSLPAC